MRKVVFLGLMLSGLLVHAATEQPAPPPALNATLGVQENLQKLVGKRATVITKSGKEYDGLIAETSKLAVLITQLTGKELYNAYVRIDDVEAVVYKAK